MTSSIANIPLPQIGPPVPIPGYGMPPVVASSTLPSTPGSLNSWTQDFLKSLSDTNAAMDAASQGGNRTSYSNPAATGPSSVIGTPTNNLIGSIINQGATNVANGSGGGSSPDASHQTGGRGLVGRIIDAASAGLNFVTGGLVGATAGVQDRGLSSLTDIGANTLMGGKSNSDLSKQNFDAQSAKTKQEQIDAEKKSGQETLAAIRQADVAPGDTIAGAKAGIDNKLGTPGQLVADDIAGRHQDQSNPLFAAAQNNPSPFSIAPDANAIANPGAAALGLGINILADPLTYVGPGEIKAVAGGVGKLKDILVGSKDVGQVAGIADAVAPKLIADAAKTTDAVPSAIPSALPTNAIKDATSMLPAPSAITNAIPAPGAIKDAIPAIPIPAESVPLADKLTQAISEPLPAEALAQVAKARITDEAAQNIAKGEAVPPVKPTVAPEDAASVAASTDAAVKYGAVSDRDQANWLASATGQYSRAANDLGLGGLQRQQFVADRALGQVQAKLDAAAAVGIKTDTGLHITDVLNASPELADMGNRLQFAAHVGQLKNHVYPSQVMAAAQKAVEVTAPGLGYTRAMQVDAMKEAITTATHGAKPIPQKSIDDLINTTLSNHYELSRAMGKRSANVQVKDAADGATLGTEASQRITNMVTNPQIATSDSVKMLSDLGGTIAKDAKARGMSNTAAQVGAAHASDTAAKVGVDSGDLGAAQAVAETTRLRAAGGLANNGRVAATQATATKAVMKDTAALVDKAIPGLANAAKDDVIALGTKLNAQGQSLISRLLNPIKTKMQFTYGSAADFNARVVQGVSSGQYESAKFFQIMRMASKEDPQAFKDAFHALQSGEIPVDASIRASYDVIKPAYDSIFDLKDGMFGAFFRNGATPSQVNSALYEVYGKQYKYDLEAAGGDWTKMANQHQNWSIEDPLDFLAKSHKASHLLASYQASGRMFSTMFGKTKDSLTPEELKEYSKIGDFIKGDKLAPKYDSKLYPHIDDTLYYPHEGIRTLTKVERALAAPTSFRGVDGAFAHAITDVYDPIIQLFKTSTTLARPGFHIRNMISDILINQLDGVRGVAPYTKAAQILHAGSQFTGDIKGLNELAYGNIASKPGAIITTATLKGGQKVKYTTVGMFKSAKDNGILVSFTAQDDLIDAAGASPLTNLAHKITMSTPIQKVGHVSELTQQGAKLAQYDALLNREGFTSQFKTIEEAEAAAAKRVRSFHPDVFGLNPFERRVMRRIIPFYSWSRQALPMMLEAMVMNPGRVSELSKGAYALSIASGGNPRSLSDQYDPNKVYPSFIRDEGVFGPLGSQGGLGYNTGSPIESLGGIFNGDVSKNVMGMVSPYLKAPIELATGTNMGTGAPLGDKSDYFDQLIPGVNQLSNISGYSPVGTIGNILGNTDPKLNKINQGKNPILDRQAQVQANNKDTFANTSTANFLAGLGIINYNQKNYQSTGQKELKQGPN